MRKSLLIRALPFTALGLLAAVPANASVLDMTYTLSNGTVFTASLNGTLQPDNNHFNVTGYNGFTVNGTPLVFTPTYFEAYTNYPTPTVDDSGVLTLDGSYENFIAYDGSTGFDFIVNAFPGQPASWGFGSF